MVGRVVILLDFIQIVLLFAEHYIALYSKDSQIRKRKYPFEN
jgi:hypothetical protein